jgi:hypothetical protein
MELNVCANLFLRIIGASLCHMPIETNRRLMEHNYYLLELQLFVETLFSTLYCFVLRLTPFLQHNMLKQLRRE